MPARILLIEDNPANLDLMTYLLKAFGYTAFTATDGAEGIAAAHRELPDLIICDVQLPVMDGLEMARHIKSDPDLRTIPLVAVTALAMVGDRDRVLAAGFNGYIAKPINPETFVQQIETFLPHDSHGDRPSMVSGDYTAPPRPTISPNRTILVVDNLAVNVELARSILEPHGYGVVTADCMAQGLALARERRFDLIVSDVCMADGTGYDFLRAIKSDPQLHAMPFVLITSTMLEDADRAKGIALGAARFLIRPIDPTAFLAEIEACLRDHSR